MATTKKFKERLALAYKQAMEDAVLYGNGFVDENTATRVPPFAVTVTTLANGMKCYTYGEMDPKNIHVTIIQA